MDKKWIFFLLADIFYTVTSAPESMFALEGNSVMLPMWKRGNLDADDAVWVFNQTKDVVRYYPHHPKSQQLRVPAPYEDRVEFDTITFSLELKNLQEFDSGLYRGEINAGWRKTVVEYRLSIFKPVSAPVLALKSVLSSDGLCNVTVSCRADDLSLTSSCKNSTCTQAKQTAFTSLSIFIKEGVIICNHSNSVNWSHDTMEIETVCSQEKPFSDKLNALICGTVFGVVALLVACGVLICCVLNFRKLSRSPGKGKVYAGKSLSPESAVKKQNPSTPRTESRLVVSVTPGSPVKTPSAINSVVVNLMTPGSMLKKRNHTPKNEKSETKSSVAVNLSSRFQS